MQKFKIGEKVYPINKTVKGYGPLDDCRHWKKAKEEGRPYLYIVGYMSNGVYVCHCDIDYKVGNYFMESDLVQYDEYLEQFKEGVKVKLISGGGKLPLLGFSDGEYYTVKGLHDNRKGTGVIIYRKDGSKGHALPHQLEIVKEKVSNNERIEALELKVAELTKELEALKDNKTADAPEDDVVEDKPYTPSVGDIVVITANTNYSRNKVGDIGKVTHFDGVDYRVDVPQRPATSESNNCWTKPTEMRKATLSEVEKYEKALSAIANKQRAEIIEKAKKFIEKSKDVTGRLSGRKGYKHNLAGYADAEFVINVEKLTIVCLLKRQFGGQILGKGITKCNPSDVFNVWIGKAIALGRALGLDVSEFEQVVQPTVAVGQLIEVCRYPDNKPLGRFLAVSGIDTNGYPTHDDGTYTSHYKIINDTNAQYGGE